MDHSVPEVGDVLEKKINLNNSQSRNPLQDYTNRTNLIRSASGGVTTALASENNSKENISKDLPASTKSIPDKADRHSFSDSSYSSNIGQTQSVETDTDTTAEFESVSEKDFQLSTESSDQHQVIPVNVLPQISPSFEGKVLTNSEENIREETRITNCEEIPSQTTQLEETISFVPYFEEACENILPKENTAVTNSEVNVLPQISPSFEGKVVTNSAENIREETRIKNCEEILSQTTQLEETPGVPRFEENCEEILSEVNFSQISPSLEHKILLNSEENFQEEPRILNNEEIPFQTTPPKETTLGVSHYEKNVEEILSVNTTIKDSEINVSQISPSLQHNLQINSGENNQKETKTTNFADISSQITPPKETPEVLHFEENCDEILSEVNPAVTYSELNVSQVLPPLEHKLQKKSEENIREETKTTNFESINDIEGNKDTSQISQAEALEVPNFVEYTDGVSFIIQSLEGLKITNIEEITSQSTQPEETITYLPHFKETCEQILSEVNTPVTNSEVSVLPQTSPSSKVQVLIKAEENFREETRITNCEEILSQTTQPKETTSDVPHFEETLDKILYEINTAVKNSEVFVLPQISPSFEGKVLTDSEENFQEETNILNNEEIPPQTTPPKLTPVVPHFVKNVEDILSINTAVMNFEVNVLPQISPSFEGKVGLLTRSEANFQEETRIANREEIPSQTTQLEQNCEEILSEVNVSQISPSLEHKVLLNSEENFQELKILNNEEPSQTTPNHLTPGMPHFVKNVEEILSVNTTVKNSEVNVLPEISPSFESKVLTNSEENFREGIRITNCEEIPSQTTQLEETPGEPHFEENCEEILSEVNVSQISPTLEHKILLNSEENFQEEPKILNNEEISSQTTPSKLTPDMPHFVKNVEEILSVNTAVKNSEVNALPQISPSFESKVQRNSEENFREGIRITNCEEIPSQTTQLEETPGVPHFEENCEEILSEVNVSQISQSLEHKILLNSEENFQEEPKILNNEEISSQTTPSKLTPGMPHCEKNAEKILFEVRTTDTDSEVIVSQISPSLEHKLLINLKENIQKEPTIVNFEEISSQTTPSKETNNVPHFKENCKEILSDINVSQVSLSSEENIQKESKTTNFESVNDIENNKDISQISQAEIPKVTNFGENTGGVSFIIQSLEGLKISNFGENVEDLPLQTTQFLIKNEVNHFVKNIQDISAPFSHELNAAHNEEICQEISSEVNTAVTNSEGNTQEEPFAISQTIQEPKNINCEEINYQTSYLTGGIETINIIKGINGTNSQIKHNEITKVSKLEENTAEISLITQTPEEPKIANLEGNFEGLFSQITYPLSNNEVKNFVENNQEISSQTTQPILELKVAQFEEKCEAISSEVNTAVADSEFVTPQIFLSLEKQVTINSEENSEKYNSNATHCLEELKIANSSLTAHENPAVRKSEVIVPRTSQSIEYSEVINPENISREVEVLTITNFEELPAQTTNLLRNIEPNNFKNINKDITSQICQQIETPKLPDLDKNIGEVVSQSTQPIENSEGIVPHISQSFEHMEVINNSEENLKKLQETKITNFEASPCQTTHFLRNIEPTHLEGNKKITSQITQHIKKPQVPYFAEISFSEKNKVSNSEATTLKISQCLENPKKTSFEGNPEDISSHIPLPIEETIATNFREIPSEITYTRKSEDNQFVEENYAQNSQFEEKLEKKLCSHVVGPKEETAISDFKEVFSNEEKCISNQSSFVLKSSESADFSTKSLEKRCIEALFEKIPETVQSENIKNRSMHMTHDSAPIDKSSIETTEDQRNVEGESNCDSLDFVEELALDSFKSMHSVLTSELNKSEAGPITADEEFSSELFQDASCLDFEYLSSVGNNCTKLSENLTRQSLYVKFDPVVKKFVSSTGNMPPPPQASGDRPSTPPTSSKSEVQKTPVRSPALDSVQKLISLTPPNTSATKSDKSLTPGVSPAASPRLSVTPHDKESPKSRGFIPQDVLDKELQKLQDAMLKREQIYEETLTKMDSNLQEQVMKKDDIIKELQKKYEEIADREAKLRYEVQDKTKSKQQLSLIMEEYEKTISQLVAQKEEEKKEFEIQKEKIISERESVMQHLNNSEIAFNDVHVKYERSKTVIERMKNNEDLLKKNLAEYQEEIKQMNEKYNILKNHAVQQIEKANKELDSLHKGHQSEIAKLKAMLKKSEISNNSLKESLEQKIKENQELTSICDELISKVN